MQQSIVKEVWTMCRNGQDVILAARLHLIACMELQQQGKCSSSNNRWVWQRHQDIGRQLPAPSHQLLPPPTPTHLVDGGGEGSRP